MSSITTIVHYPYTLPCWHLLLPSTNSTITTTSTLGNYWTNFPFNWSMMDSNLPAAEPAEPAQRPQPHDIYINQGHELVVRSLYIQASISYWRTSQQAHITKMQHMFFPQTATAPTANMEVEDTSDNVSSIPHQKPIIQEFVLPAPTSCAKKSQRKARARALIGAELAKRNSHTKKRCRRGEVSHQETEEVISVILSIAPM
ncbi:hypothetical protein BGX38DRAFT_1204187 [Terfezia claveryi]|nr:hypothetical protein BGX38DRAFT_1204187 [Terfezia claveryi]